MVLIQALSKVAENLTKHGGSQAGFRIAAARQELEVDRRPTLITTMQGVRKVPTSGGGRFGVDAVEMGSRNRTGMPLVRGGLRLGASVASPALSPTLGRASTSQTGVFIAPGRTTSRRIAHMVENDREGMERRRPS